MYRVLYRKWRPQTFDDVCGQPQVTVTLKNEIKNGRISHAYLFTGSRGTGKTSCAKILAKSLNCLNPHDGNPCGECENCKEIDNGSFFDVVEMDAASNRGIDDIRSIIDEVNFTPAKGKYRVYIIDEVHMLTVDAFNALLKTLEEPPSHAVFILATTEVHKLLPTILSRCQRFDFRRIAPDDIAKRLKYVAQQENVTITDEAALLTASIADGALRDALSLMDRCIGISQSIDAETVRKAAGLAQNTYIFELANCFVNKNCAKALSIIDTLHSNSKDMSRLCEELCSHFRSLMIIKTCQNPRDMLVMSDNEFEAAQSQCDYLSLSEIIYFMDILQRGFERMSKGTNNRTELEMAVVKMCSPELDVTNEAILNRLSALEKAVNKGIALKQTAEVQSQSTDYTEALNSHTVDNAEKNTFADNEQNSSVQRSDAVTNKTEQKEIKVQQPEVTAPSEPTSAQRRPVDTKAIYENAVPFNEWPEVINNLKQYSRTIAASFEGTRAYTSGGYLLIEADTEIPFRLMQQSAQKEKIRVAIQEITGKVYRLGPYKKPQQQEKPKDPLAGFLNDLKNDGVSVTIEAHQENQE